MTDEERLQVLVDRMENGKLRMMVVAELLRRLMKEREIKTDAEVRER